MVNYILPAFLINVISLFVFMMPSESGEKITLGISAMLNMTVRHPSPPLPSPLNKILIQVFLMAVVGNLPPTEKTSIISTTHIIIIIHLRLTLMLRCVLQPHLGGHHVSDRH